VAASTAEHARNRRAQVSVARSDASVEQSSKVGEVVEAEEENSKHSGKHKRSRRIESDDERGDEEARVDEEMAGQAEQSSGVGVEEQGDERGSREQQQVGAARRGRRLRKLGERAVRDESPSKEMGQDRSRERRRHSGRQYGVGLGLGTPGDDRGVGARCGRGDGGRRRYDAATRKRCEEGEAAWDTG